MKLNSLFTLVAISLLLFSCSAQQETSQTTEQSASSIPVSPSDTSIVPTTQPDKTTPETIIETKIPAEEQTETLVVNRTKEETPSKTIFGSDRCRDTDMTSEFPDGFNVNLAGNITVNGKPIINGHDYCPNVVMLSEWYCLNSVARVKTAKCESGNCKLGVCV